jgi:hypothetical protein
VSNANKLRKMSFAENTPTIVMKGTPTTLFGKREIGKSFVNKLELESISATFDSF